MEMTLRHYEIWHWLQGIGPEPDPDWKPEHPPKDEAERQRDIEEYVERFYKRCLAQEAILEQDPDDPFYTGAGAPGVQRTTNGEG